MKKLIELRQQKTAIAEQMRTLLTQSEQEKRSLNDEEAKQFDELRSQADSLNTDIARYEAIVEETRAKTDITTPVSQPLTNAELRHYVMTGDTRSLSTSVSADGGYTVIPELDKQIMRRLTDNSEMRQICTVKRVHSNEYKKLVSLGGATVTHGVEGTAHAETNTSKLAEVSIKLFPIYAYPKTTQEILDFSDVDILSWLTEEIADTFTETEETDLVTGDGDKKAKGFLAYTREVKNDKDREFGKLEKLVTAGAAPTADELIDLIFKLKKQYRKNAVWVMNSNTAATLQKLKNSNGDYIWRDRMQAGDPDMLLGHPVHYLEYMPDAAAGKAVLAVGDFKRGYTIVDHETGTRNRPDNITAPGFFKLHSSKYLGGGLVDSNAIKVLEIKAAGSGGTGG